MSHHALQHRKIGKKTNNPVWIPNSRWSVSFAREQRVLQGCAHGHWAVGQWGAGEGDTAPLTPPQVHCHSQPGKRIVSSSFPSAVYKQRYCHTLETLIAVRRAGPKGMCQGERVVPVLGHRVWMSPLPPPNTNCCTPQKILYKYLDTPIVLYPWLLLLPNASQYCLILI